MREITESLLLTGGFTGRVTVLQVAASETPEFCYSSKAVPTHLTLSGENGVLPWNPSDSCLNGNPSRRRGCVGNMAGSGFC